MKRAVIAALLSALCTAVPGFYELRKDANSVWWFVRPDGALVQSYVANHVNDGGPDDGVGGREAAVCRAATGSALCGDSLNFGGALGYAPYYNVTQDKYGGSARAWANASLDFLGSLGFGGISGWSAEVAQTAARERGLGYFRLLDIGTTWPHSGEGLDWDVWSANFSAQCEAIAAAEVAPRARDPALIAWQTDNENNWRAVGLARYLVAYAAGPGGAAALGWLQARYASLAALNAAWGTAAASWAALGAALPARNAAAFAADDADFVALVAGRYMNITTAAIRRHDANHLISGVRFNYVTPQIVRAVAPFVDLLDQHDYGDLPDVAWLAQMSALAGGKPVVLGEMSFTAADSNLPNTHGARAGNPEVTQTRRATRYAAYMRALLPLPFVAGYGWWNFVDEPATGRWPDGENSNYGLRTLADDPYAILAETMAAVHAAAPQWHATGKAPPPAGAAGAAAGEL